MREILDTKAGQVAALAALGVLFAWWITRQGNAKAFGQAIAGGVAGVVTDTAAGAVIGIGQAIGIPETDADACSLDLARGDLLAASFSCPAPRFARHLIEGPDYETRRARFILDEKANP